VDSGLRGRSSWHEHLTDAELDYLLQGTFPRKDSLRQSQVVRHLLKECAVCKDRSRERHSLQKSYNYDSAFTGAEQALGAFFAQGAAPEAGPEVLLAELQSLPQEEQSQRIVSSSRYANPSLIDFLIEQSHGKRYKDTDEMLHLAHLAVIAADSCSVEGAGSEPRLSDLRGRAWGCYGNSLRICSRLPEAEAAIATAQRHLDAGTGDPPVQARLFEQKISLRMFQGRYPEAIEAAEEAARIYEAIGQTHNFASSLVQKAIVCQYAGEPEDAITVLNQAIPLIDPEKNPHLLLAACHNLVHSYISLDRPEQALSLYFETRSLYKDFEDDLILLRMGWQEGQLLRDLGHLEAAETALLQARKGFLEQNQSHEVALVSLDLAWVYVKLGRVEDLKKTVTEAIPIFQALRVGREAIAALLQLQHAEGQEQKALELIRLLNTRLAPLSHRTTK
jgi:tetratricopeptide (TPR) repeat protein